MEIKLTQQQKNNLKRLAALYAVSNGREAIYLHQKQIKSWTANDLPDDLEDMETPVSVLMYKGNQYKTLEEIVADVLDIHEDGKMMLQINNGRIACGKPAFMTYENAKSLGYIPGDTKQCAVNNCRDYLKVYGINPSDVFAMCQNRIWQTMEASFENEFEAPWKGSENTRVIAIPLAENSEMGGFYSLLVDLGKKLLADDHKVIKWGDANVVPDLETLLRIWDDRPGHEITIGHMECFVPEEIDGVEKAGSYKVVVRASGKKGPSKAWEYNTRVILYHNDMQIGVFAYPFVHDKLASLVSDETASLNWVRLTDYVRYADPIEISGTLCKGA